MTLFQSTYQNTSTRHAIHCPYSPNIVKMVLWSFLLLFLIGCVHFEQSVTIREDGSMEVTYHYSVPIKYVPVIKSSKKIIEQKQGIDAANTALRWPLNKELALKIFNTNRTTLKAYNTWENDNRKHVKLTFTGENIRDINKKQELPRIAITKISSNNNTVKYKLHFTPVATDTENKTLTDDGKKSLRELLKGLRLKLTLTTPGKIVTATGELVNQNTAQWSYRVEENHDSSWLWKTPAITAVFETETELFTAQ